MPRNDAGTPEQIVLSDAVTQAVGGRRVTAAVFTTFEFEPDFFELHVLPCLFPNVAWSHMPNVKRVQVGEALLGLEHAAVFYDRRGLRPEGGAARLDYERIGLARPAGVFHAKNILLLLESPAEDGADNDKPLPEPCRGDDFREPDAEWLARKPGSRAGAGDRVRRAQRRAG